MTKDGAKRRQREVADERARVDDERDLDAIDRGADEELVVASRMKSKFAVEDRRRVLGGHRRKTRLGRWARPCLRHTRGYRGRRAWVTRHPARHHDSSRAATGGQQQRPPQHRAAGRTIGIAHASKTNAAKINAAFIRAM